MSERMRRVSLLIGFALFLMGIGWVMRDGNYERGTFDVLVGGLILAANWRKES